MPSDFDFSRAIMHDSPADLARWPETTQITAVHVLADHEAFAVDFSKKDGPGRWPDVRPDGWDGSLQYTLGMALFIHGAWHASAVIECWYGRASCGGPANEVAVNWFYSDRWGDMQGHQPAIGETVGFFVMAGDGRGHPRGDLSPVKERSNVVFVQWPNGPRTFTFDGQPTPAPGPVPSPTPTPTPAPAPAPPTETGLAAQVAALAATVNDLLSRPIPPQVDDGFYRQKFADYDGRLEAHRLALEQCPRKGSTVSVTGKAKVPLLGSVTVTSTGTL